ncbi:hypothetical protein ON010_g4642 [Phytophthora cinnamomi]|nr:hypothetical protein ON010_g4642 [Phytophthora cinnamomi]
MMTTRRAKVKVILGWERVYVFEVWIMVHCAGVEVVLGTDVMIPAGIRLDLLNATANLFRRGDDPADQDSKHDGRGRRKPRRDPADQRHGSADSAKYKEWQVLAYAAARDKTLLKWEAELYQQWLAKQPPAVERPSYPTPKGILERADEDSGEKPLANSKRDSADDLSVTDDSEWMAEEHHRRLDVTAGDSTRVTTTDDEAMPPEAAVSGLETSESKTFIAVMRVLVTEGTADRDDETTEHPAAAIELEDYAHELAFLPDLSETVPTTLDYSAANVTNPELSEDQQENLIEASTSCSMKCQKTAFGPTRRSWTRSPSRLSHERRRECSLS